MYKPGMSAGGSLCPKADILGDEKPSLPKDPPTACAIAFAQNYPRLNFLAIANEAAIVRYG